MRNPGIDWDDEKAEINIKKHGLSFDEAQKVFQDDDAIIRYDRKHSTIDDERYITIGRIQGLVVVNVVHQQKDGTKRIITARHATKSEWRMYYEQSTEFSQGI